MCVNQCVMTTTEIAKSCDDDNYDDMRVTMTYATMVNNYHNILIMFCLVSKAYISQ